MMRTILAFLLLCATAHAGEPSIRRLRKETRISVLRPIRAQGRAAAGYPFLQTMKYTAGTAYRVSGFFSPGAFIANIIFR